MHEVLVNRVGGLSLPRKCLVRLTDRPDMTLDVYRDVKQQHNNNKSLHLGVMKNISQIFILMGPMVLGKLPLPGVLLILINVGQRPIALAVGAGWGCLDLFFSRLSFLFSFSLSLLSPKQPTNRILASFARHDIFLCRWKFTVK